MTQIKEMTPEKFRALSAIKREQFIKSLTPEELADAEGKLFINLSLESNTQFGRVLSFFHKQNFIHPQFQHFATLEGYWLWLRTKGNPDALRSLSGPQAIAFARDLKVGYLKTFKSDFISGVFYKIVSTKRHLTIVRQQPPLAVVSYYVRNGLLIYVANRQWVYNAIEDLHDYILSTPPGTTIQPYVYKE